MTKAGGIYSMNSSGKTGKESVPSLFIGTSTQGDALKDALTYLLIKKYFFCFDELR